MRRLVEDQDFPFVRNFCCEGFCSPLKYVCSRELAVVDTSRKLANRWEKRSHRTNLELGSEEKFISCGYEDILIMIGCGNFQQRKFRLVELERFSTKFNMAACRARCRCRPWRNGRSYSPSLLFVIDSTPSLVFFPSPTLHTVLPEPRNENFER